VTELFGTTERLGTIPKKPNSIIHKGGYQFLLNSKPIINYTPNRMQWEDLKI